MEGLSDILNLVLGGGLAATIAAGYKGIKTIREGAKSKEKELVADLRDWRREANQARVLAERQRDYWRDLAADYRFILKDRFGVELPDPKPPELDPPDREIA